MSIVLNEYDWAEQMINKHDLGNKPSETLSRVAKYYMANKYSKSETRRILDTFLLSCNPDASLANWSDTLDKAMRAASRYAPVQLDGIRIYKPELDKIDAVPGKQNERLAFTLLCVAKYWDSVNPRNDHWANSPDTEIMQMANIRASIKRQSLMFAKLKECGLIRFSKKVDNLNVQVLFIDEHDEVVLFVRDFRNLGYQYLQYRGEPYFQCANCGLTVKENEPCRGRKQKYCPSCALELHTKQRIESVMRHRNYVQSHAVT